MQIRGYDCILANTKKSGKGRVICYVQSNIPFNLVTIEDDGIDVVAIDCKGLRIIGIYKPFKIPSNYTSSPFLFRLLDTLTKLTKTQKQVIIGGDFNVNLDFHSSELDMMEDWAITCGLQQLIEAGTITRSRIVNSENGVRIESSTLDHVYTTFSKNELIINLQSSVSDHVNVIISKSARHHSQKEKMTIRDWRFYYKDKASHILAQRTSQISDFSYENLVNAYQDTQNEIAPLQVVRYREDQIISTKVAALQKRRDRFLKKYKENWRH